MQFFHFLQEFCTEAFCHITAQQSDFDLVHRTELLGILPDPWSLQNKRQSCKRFVVNDLINRLEADPA
ncbi:hypothetical protein D3C80_1908290 [compost metagenome]